MERYPSIYDFDDEMIKAILPRVRREHKNNKTMLLRIIPETELWADPEFQLIVWQLIRTVVGFRQSSHDRRLNPSWSYVEMGMKLRRLTETAISK